MRKIVFRLFLLLLVLIVAIIACTGLNGDEDVQSNEQISEAEITTPGTIEATATFGAEQFHIQLTAIAGPNQ